MDTANRASIIDTRLTNHFHNDMGANVSAPEPAWWWDNLEFMGPWAILGFGIPFDHPDVEGEIIVPFCPQVIERWTWEYDNDTFDEYLTLICAVLGLYLAHMDIEDKSERHEIVALELGGMSEQALDEIQNQVDIAEFARSLEDL